MPAYTVRADWIGAQSFVLKDKKGFPVVMAQPMGVSAADLLPLSLCGCSGYDVIGIALKQRQEVTALEICADYEQDDDPPWRFRRIHITYRFKGRSLQEHHLRRAVELAEEKYCAVYATLRDAVEITNAVEIEEE